MFPNLSIRLENAQNAPTEGWGFNSLRSDLARVQYSVGKVLNRPLDGGPGGAGFRNESPSLQTEHRYDSGLSASRCSKDPVPLANNFSGGSSGGDVDRTLSLEGNFS